MSKMVPDEVEYCLECPKCEKPGSKAPMRIQQKSMCEAVTPHRKITDRLNKKTPIPEWCPYPNKEEGVIYEVVATGN